MRVNGKTRFDTSSPLRAPIHMHEFQMYNNDQPEGGGIREI